MRTLFALASFIGVFLFAGFLSEITGYTPTLDYPPFECWYGAFVVAVVGAGFVGFYLEKKQ